MAAEPFGQGNEIGQGNEKGDPHERSVFSPGDGCGTSAFPHSTSYFARRLETRGDPDNARIVVWLLKADDERLLGFGLTREDIARLQGVVQHELISA